MNQIYIFFAVACLIISQTSNGAEVSFDQALEALTNSDITVEQARVDYESASEAYRQSLQSFLPRVGAEASMSRQKDVDATGLEAGFDADFNLFRFGGDVAVRNSRAAQMNAAEDVYSAAKAKAGWRAARIILDLLEAKEALETEQKFIALKKSSLVTIEKLFRSGTRPAQDVEKLTLDVLSEEEQMAKLDLAFELALSNLRKASPDVALAGGWPWMDLILKSTKEKWRDLSSRAALPGVKAAKYTAASLASTVSEKRAGLLPSLDLQGKYVWARSTVVSQWQPVWTAALVLKMPIYQRGSNYFGLHEAERDLYKANLDLAQRERDEPEVRITAQKNLEAAVSTLKNRAALTSRARVLYDQSMLAFGRGVLSVNDLLDDQSRMVKAEQGASEAAAAAHHSLLGFCEAMNIGLRDCLH